MTRYASVLELIGQTPVVDVSALSPKPHVTILAKLEGRNPAGSVKDRVALSLVEAAERDGRLIPGQPGQILIEPSSGNTGIALALVCRLRGYHLKVVLPTNVSPERRQLLQVFGAEIIDSPGAEGSNGAVRLAQALSAENPEWVFLYQYANPANPAAHYATTGPEILDDVPEITHFVAGLGTSGTLMGVGRYLKEKRPDVQVWAVEPPSGEMVDGLRSLDDGYVPPIFIDNHGEELLDRKVIVRPRESIEWTRRLSEVGLFVGHLLGCRDGGRRQVRSDDSRRRGRRRSSSIIADDGWKYLSTGAWSDDLDDVVERASPRSTSKRRRSILQYRGHALIRAKRRTMTSRRADGRALDEGATPVVRARLHRNGGGFGARDGRAHARAVHRVGRRGRSALAAWHRARAG